jgi:ribosomal protein S6--L-glutamate ligase
MKAAIISLGSVSSQWVANAMKQEFDEVDELDLRKIEITLGSGTKIRYDDGPMEKYDCIYTKGSFRYSSLLRAITSVLQPDTYLPARDHTFTIVHNKLLGHIVLQEASIPMPLTYLTSTAEATRKLLASVNYPIVMKLPEGTQGKGVMFAESYSSASSLFDALQSLRQPFIIQEYVETNGRDIRAIVVGDRVAASMQRIAVQGEKRANIHAGAIGEPIDLDPATESIAVKAAKAVGAEICGVDMLIGRKGPLVIEINVSPGLQGITKATGLDVAAMIAKHLYKRAEEFSKLDQSAKQDRYGKIMA